MSAAVRRSPSATGRAPGRPPGVDEEVLTAVSSVDDLVARLLAARPGLAAVLPVCSVLVGGRASTGADPVPPGAVVEVLPPFAGG